MDVAQIVVWIQLGIWIFSTVLWIGRIVRGEIRMSPWLKKLFSSNGLLGFVILLGLILSGISVYMSYTVNAYPKAMTLNISAYEPEYSAPMQVISNKTFENQDIPLDGYTYDHCTFTNVCFLFDGGAYQLQNSTVKVKWKVCVRDKRLKNYADLMRDLKLLNPKVSYGTSKLVVPLR